MQSGKRHHAGAKWHFNTRCILGVRLSTQTAGMAVKQEIGSLKDTEKQAIRKDHSTVC